jgi:hypothetical protein
MLSLLVTPTLKYKVTTCPSEALLSGTYTMVEIALSWSVLKEQNILFFPLK